MSAAEIERQQNRAELESIKADGERVRAEQAEVVLRLAKFVRSGRWRKIEGAKHGKYRSVTEFFECEFPGDGLAAYVIQAAERRELVAALKFQNMANTRIAGLLGVNEGTVRLDLGTKPQNTGYEPRSQPLAVASKIRINPNPAPSPQVSASAPLPVPAQQPEAPSGDQDQDGEPEPQEAPIAPQPPAPPGAPAEPEQAEDSGHADGQAASEADPVPDAVDILLETAAGPPAAPDPGPVCQRPRCVETRQLIGTAIKVKEHMAAKADQLEADRDRLAAELAAAREELTELRQLLEQATEPEPQEAQIGPQPDDPPGTPAESPQAQDSATMPAPGPAEPEEDTGPCTGCGQSARVAFARNPAGDQAGSAYVCAPCLASFVRKNPGTIYSRTEGGPQMTLYEANQAVIDDVADAIMAGA